MSSPQRMLISTALVIAGVISSASTGAAQGFRRPVVVRAPVFVGAYYSPYWSYDPWFGYGFGEQLYPWGPYPYPPYRMYNVDPGAAMRLEVKPREAEVYIDGFYAGIVDDFDGTFQRLRARPGEHEIVLYLDGFRTVRQRVLLTPNNTVKVKYVMEKLGAGEQPEARPQPPSPPVVQAGPPQPLPPNGRGPGRRAPQGPPPGQPFPPGQPGQPGPPMAGGPPRGGDPSAYGTIAIRIQPGDAEVLIDGEPWRGPEGQDRLLVDVAEGQHTVEIRKPGYRSYVTDVQVRRGDTTPVNVSLRTQED